MRRLLTLTSLSDVTKPKKTLSITPGPHSGFGCQAVAMGLSPKPHGRFCLFLAGELIWSSRRHIQIIINIRSMPELLEVFFFHFHGNTFGIFSKFYFTKTFSDPSRVYMPNFIRIRQEMAEELINTVTKIWLICSRFNSTIAIILQCN